MNQQDHSKELHKKLFTFTISLQLISTVLLYIISFIWFLRIYPYFSNGIGVSYWIYIILLCQIIYITFIFLCYLFFFSIHCHKIKCDSKKILNEKSIILLSIFGIILESPIVITGIWLSLQAIKKGNSINNRCYSYLFYGLLGADTEYSNPKYQKWRNNFVKHAYDQNGHLTNYLCGNVSIPTLVSALAILTSMILFANCVYLTCKHFINNRNGLLTVNLAITAPLTVSVSSISYTS